MNKKAIITALLALIVIVANGQQRLTVRDSLTQEPIAYTSVWFGNEAGGYTDESGTIEIPEGTKRIRLSHICYETRSISIADNSGQTVLLVPKSPYLFGLARLCMISTASAISTHLSRLASPHTKPYE